MVIIPQRRDVRVDRLSTRKFKKGKSVFTTDRTVSHTIQLAVETHLGVLRVPRGWTLPLAYSKHLYCRTTRVSGRVKDSSERTQKIRIVARGSVSRFSLWARGSTAAPQESWIPPGQARAIYDRGIRLGRSVVAPLLTGRRSRNRVSDRGGETFGLSCARSETGAQQRGRRTAVRRAQSRKMQHYSSNRTTPELMRKRRRCLRAATWEEATDRRRRLRRSRQFQPKLGRCHRSLGIVRLSERF